MPSALTDEAAPATRGDLDLDPQLWERAGVTATRPAAVLVPVIDRPQPTILLTLRNATSSRFSLSRRIFSTGTYRVRLGADAAHEPGNSRTRRLGVHR